jgi:tetratricopeptide (TPR) repeat protein
MDGTGGQEDPGGLGNVAHAAEVGSLVQIGNLAGGLNMVLPGARRGVPREVPAPPVTFVDRSDILAWLSEQVADQGQPPCIAVVAGLPGMGKRAVVRRWVHQSRDRFPGGDLYLDCARFGGAGGSSAVDVSGMLASCLRALGLDEQYLPAGLDERMRLFRSETAGRPVLVVVENATEPAQVVPLMPNSAGSAVLVTTSTDLGELRLDGAGFCDLGQLDAASAGELLGKVCGAPRVAAEPQGAADLVRWSGGLPIAVVVLGARVAASRGLAISELAGELADDSRRLAGLTLRKVTVAAAFSSCYERLPRPAQHLYRRLGLLPCADFGPGVAGVAAGIGPADAGRLLDELVAAYLLEARPGGRYGFHDLVRLHARDQGQDEPAAGQEAIARAVTGYYLVRAAFADRAVMGSRARIADHTVLLAGHEDPFTGPGARDAALAWLDAERPNFIPVLQAACVQGWDSEAWQLAEALTGYFFNHRYLADWITVSEAGAQAARRCGNLRAEARLRIAVSRAYTDLGELDRARSELDEAAQIAGQSGDLVLQASAWEFRGRYLDATGDHQQALAAYQRAHDLNVQAGEWRGVALTLYYAGCSLTAAGQPAQALEPLQQALDLLRWSGDTRMAGRALIAVAAAQGDLRGGADAVATLEEAIRELSGLHYQAQAWELLAEITTQQGDHQAAQQHLRRAAVIYAAEGHPKARELAARLDPGQP